MKVAHWTAYNKSGMNRVAESISEAERKLGIDSLLVDLSNGAAYAQTIDADIHVAHTHFPDSMRSRLSKPLKLVWVGHGTPEHVFQSSVEEGHSGKYGAGDGWMLIQYWLQYADALVTFWPRHQAIWQSLVDKGRKVHCIPLGVDKDFWRPIPSLGKYAGTPSLFSCENAHYIKWPLDLFIMWPWVYPELPGACLHVAYLPTDVHRWFFPLVNRNGASYASHITARIFSHEELRNIFNSVDYYIGLVKYGDFNRLCLEAKSCGCKTISYAGNEYADFWLPEGDQRVGAHLLKGILKGEIAPRETPGVPSIEETAKGMISIYEEVLK